MTIPAWVWAVAAVGLIAVIAAEIALTGRAGSGTVRSGASGAGTARQAAAWAGVYVSLAAAFGLAVGITAGWVMAGQFYAGYLTEYSLNLDNLFVFYVIMTWFAVPPARRARVLLLGIGLALVMRSALIVAGAAALNRFGWLFYPLGGILVWTAVGLFLRSGVRGQDERHTRLAWWLRRRLRRPGRQTAWGSAPVLLLLAGAIGLADLVFAVDSIPAVFGITTSAALVVACNVFALMALRQLYALAAGMLGRMAYLNTGLAVVCAFIGVTLLLHALRGSGVWGVQIPAWLSVLVVVTVLLATVLAGWIHGRRPLSAAERAMLERRFAVVDTDRNGVWQRDDGQLLTRRLCEAFGHGADSPAGDAMATAQRDLFDAMLSYMDADGDRAITRDEFVTAVGQGVRDQPRFDAAVGSAALSLIRVADQDGNGVLDASEYIRLAAVYGVRADEAERTFGRLDQDRNGVLDAAELTLAISQFFASRDPGGPGHLAFGQP
jgi:tellurite resistance protein TerC